MDTRDLIKSFLVNFATTLAIMAVLPVVSLIAGRFLGFSIEVQLIVLNITITVSLVFWLIYTRLSSMRVQVIQTRIDGRIYIVERNSVRHIPNPPTFNYLGAYFGFGWGDVKEVLPAELDRYTRGSELPSIISHCPSPEVPPRQINL